VVNEPIDHRRGHGVVAEDLAPGRERFVARDDELRTLIAPRDEVEHQVRGRGIESTRRGVSRPSGEVLITAIAYGAVIFVVWAAASIHPRALKRTRWAPGPMRR